MDKDSMRNISGQEGFDLRFNLNLGDESKSTGENVGVNIRDADGFGSNNSRNLGIVGLWLTLGIGGSNNDAIGIDTINNSNTNDNPVLQLSMNDGETFNGIEGDIDEIQITDSETASSGDGTFLTELSIHGWGSSSSDGSLDFDGNLQVWGNNE